MGKIIDVSKWNYPVDWDAVVKAGVTGVIVRAGSGVTEDDRMKYFTNEVIKRGLDLGFYWFVYIHSGRTIAANCIKFEQTIRPYKDKIDLGVWCDFEYDTEEKLSRYDTNTLTRVSRSTLIANFCQTMNFYGYKCGYYANRDYLLNHLSHSKLKDFPLWYARYTSKEDDYTKSATLWQYTNSGKIGGKNFDISKRVDTDSLYPGIGLVAALNAIGIPSSFEHRKEIARANGIDGYTGTAEQNTKLMVLLAKGKLKKE